MRESVQYEAVQHSTVAVVADKRISPPGAPVRGVYCRKLNITAEVQVRLGPQGTLMTLRQGDGIEVPADSPPIIAGVYLNAAAGGAGAYAEMSVVLDDAEGGARGPAFRIVRS